MAQKSGFFNALLIDNDYDRKYNANDYSDNLAVIISNGVLRSTNDDLRCTASGMSVSVGIGRAWINGHYYLNDTPFAFSPTATAIGGKRYDRIMLRLDNQIAGRRISLVYVQGETAATPQKPAPTRTDNIFDLVLCDIFVDTNASSLVLTDTRADNSICGWVYSVKGDDSFFQSLDNDFMNWFDEKKDTLSSVTLFKRYNWRQVLTATATSVAFNIPQYEPDTCFLEVFVNGILETATVDYTLNANVISFSGTLTAGTEIEVKCYKSIDGTGIQSVADEITALQDQVATIIGANKFAYNCTGLQDNVALSQIAQAIYAGSYAVDTLSAPAEAFLAKIGGNTYLAQLPPEAQVEIDVVGKLGATSAYAGSGTTASRYRWFALGVAGTSEKKLIFNFSKCQKITIACSANTNNIIFYGTDLYINNANVYAYSDGAACVITMIAGSANTGKMNFNDCWLSISTSGDAVISENGTFTNCYSIVKSSSGNAYCYNAKSVSIIRIIGGTHFAYYSASGKTAAIMNIASGESNAVIMATNINCPTVNSTGFNQLNLAAQGAGNIQVYGVCSTMNSAGNPSINGQIWKSKQ